MGLTLAAVQTRWEVESGTWTYQWSGANGPIANATNLSYVISAGCLQQQWRLSNPDQRRLRRFPRARAAL